MKDKRDIEYYEVDIAKLFTDHVLAWGNKWLLCPSFLGDKEFSITVYVYQGDLVNICM